MAWSDQQIKVFYKKIVKVHGGGWRYFTEETKRAYIAREVLAVVAGQARETVKVNDVQDLWSKFERLFFGGGES